MPDGEHVNPVLPAFSDVVFSLVPLLILLPLAVLLVGSLVSINRRSATMSGLEELGWYAFVVFAQLIGTLVWFLFARDRYESVTSPSRSVLAHARGIR